MSNSTPSSESTCEEICIEDNKYTAEIFRKNSFELYIGGCLTAKDQWHTLPNYEKLYAEGLLSLKNGDPAKSKEEEFRLAAILLPNLVQFFSEYEEHDGCLFTTANGYVGSATKEVRCDAVVCILFSCNVPFVMRPQDDGTYVIVDVAYVDGIMGGEFLQDRASYQDVEFVIS